MNKCSPKVEAAAAISHFSRVFSGGASRCEDAGSRETSL